MADRTVGRVEPPPAQPRGAVRAPDVVAVGLLWVTRELQRRAVEGDVRQGVARQRRVVARRAVESMDESTVA